MAENIKTKQYLKSLEDEIDWKIIDQLHSATSNFSATSLELKKLFFVLIGIALPLIMKISGDKLDKSLFITFYVLILAFWFLDGYTYFYQEKLREKMDTHFSNIKSRNAENLILHSNISQDFTLENNRTSKNRLWRSFTNVSVRLYFVMLILNSFVFLLFFMNIIR